MCSPAAAEWTHPEEPIDHRADQLGRQARGQARPVDERRDELAGGCQTADLSSGSRRARRRRPGGGDDVEAAEPVRCALYDVALSRAVQLVTGVPRGHAVGLS
jgi:hypothetical protein